MAEGTEQFYDSWNLSDEDKGFIQSSNYADPSAVIKALRDTKAYVGADKNTIVRIPKPAEDGSVDYSEVYKTLGRPDDASGYGFEDTEFAKAAAPKLFELGITKKQAEELMSFMSEYGTKEVAAQADAAAAAREKGIAALQKKWGSDYEVNSEVAAKAVRELAQATGISGEDLDKIEDFIGVEKAAELFFAIGSKEGGVKSLTNYNAGVETPEIAAYKLKELMADKETAKLLAQKDHKTMTEIKRLTALSMGGNK